MDCYATTATNQHLGPDHGRWDEYAHAPPFTHRWHYPLLHANALAGQYAAPPHHGADLALRFPTLTLSIDERELASRQYGNIPELAAQIWQALPADVSLGLEQDAEPIYPDASPDDAVPGPPTSWDDSPAQPMKSVPDAAVYLSPTASQGMWDQHADLPASGLSVDTTMAQVYLPSVDPSTLSPGASQEYDTLFHVYTCDYEPQVDTVDEPHNLHPLLPTYTSACYALTGALTPITPPLITNVPPAPAAPPAPPSAPAQPPRAPPPEKLARPFLHPLTPPPGALQKALATPPDPAQPQPPSARSNDASPHKHPLPALPLPQLPAPVPYIYPKLGLLPGESTFHMSSPTATPEDAKPGSAAPSEPPREKKKPAMACLFCRERKIACVPLGIAPEVGCNQCVKRRLTCVYPTESRRGRRPRKPAAECEPPKPVARAAKIASARTAHGEAWDVRVVATLREQRKERVRSGSAEVKVEL